MQEFLPEPYHPWRFSEGRRGYRIVMTLPFGQNRTTTMVSEVNGRISAPPSFQR